jgi:hypothetical protein
MERKWWTLTAVSVATFMLLLDITDAYALSLAGVVLALWLVREREIEREPLALAAEPGASTVAGAVAR